MKKDFLIIGGLAALIVALLFLNASANIFVKNFTPQSATSTQIKIDGAQITAEIAKTPQARNKGLSGRDSLPTGSGMLFVFDKEDTYSFWMKDTKFPLDFIWISKDKKISDITNSAQPESGTPDQLLRVYKATEPVLYVLEIPAETAKTYNFRIGDTVEFSL